MQEEQEQLQQQQQMQLLLAGLVQAVAVVVVPILVVIHQQPMERKADWDQIQTLPAVAAVEEMVTQMAPRELLEHFQTQAQHILMGEQLHMIS
jgi:uncharacterized membrane protein required for colicin V production